MVRSVSGFDESAHELAASSHSLRSLPRNFKARTSSIVEHTKDLSTHR